MSSSRLPVTHPPLLFLLLNFNAVQRKFDLKVLAFGIQIDSMTVDGHTFDYIVTGGGLVGLTVASRLSEDLTKSILVVEAGAITWMILECLIFISLVLLLALTWIGAGVPSKDGQWSRASLSAIGILVWPLLPFSQGTIDIIVFCSIT
jgi:hypothetical protein